MRHLPKKRFGQNFLQDAGVLHQIIEAIAPLAADCMVEIGPGKGAMTAHLLTHLNELHVVELDRDLVALLEKTFANRGLIIHSADALQFHFDQLRSDDESSHSREPSLQYIDTAAVPFGTVRALGKRSAFHAAKRSR